MEYTTLALCKKHGACTEGYAMLKEHLGKGWKASAPIPLLTVLESNGVQDAIWALRTLEGKDREIRHFACDCAERVLPIYEKKYPDDKRPRNAIEISRKFAAGLATAEELAAARAAAWAATAAAAAWTVARIAAMNADGAAAWAVAMNAEREWQAERFKFYFCGDVDSNDAEYLAGGK